MLPFLLEMFVYLSAAIGLHFNISSE